MNSYGFAFYHILFPIPNYPPLECSIPAPLVETQNQSSAENSGSSVPKEVEVARSKKLLPTVTREDLLREGYEVTKRPWTEEEDLKLKEYVEEQGLLFSNIA